MGKTNESRDRTHKCKESIIVLFVVLGLLLVDFSCTLPVLAVSARTATDLSGTVHLDPRHLEALSKCGASHLLCHG